MDLKKVVICVLGSDRPGIVASISKVLYENQCNIEDVSQTILQSVFAGVFIAGVPEEMPLEVLSQRLQERLGPLGLAALVRPVSAQQAYDPPPSEPFVVITIGPDRMGLVAGITEVMARFGVNITNLRAAFRGGTDPQRNVMIYEVDIPLAIDQKAFRKALRERAQALDLDLSLQHRDIFQAIHRV
ncbi:glycine cleavage system transcriptional repressor [Desulfacinum hydrothermale DSM 13146]|uniref:Glycine cleavage system transcriptional repressor n=1 Tax=Desulfacinum hydrothermale DSM 13146 TaxID=1121390 RepID=A0A1W1X359_9BACT|nr:ACT domain-containing protein [Desulfacinum hydrothermale]SMC17831.1 glycine cleavage system transcriptional repressor [Desulfacinum hydrothermale DSM 13146]